MLLTAQLASRGLLPSSDQQHGLDLRSPLYTARTLSGAVPRPVPHAGAATLHHPAAGCLYAARKVTAAAEGEGDGPDDEQGLIFNRVTEVSDLLGILGQPPMTITVIAGTPSSGKSAVLAEVSRQLKMRAPVFSIDCRGQKLSSPAVFSKAFSDSGDSILRQWQKFVAGTTIGQSLGEALKLAGSVTEPVEFSDSTTSINFATMLVSLKSKATDLNSLFGTLNLLLQKTQAEGGPVPVFTIDEANVLAYWQQGSPEHQSDLLALFRFFIKITKQDGTAHVVLISSEASFVGWLTRHIGFLNLSTYVIADFEKEEARQYLGIRLQRQASTEIDFNLEITDEEFDLVYEVCGGHAGCLNLAAGYYVAHKDWRRALRAISAAYSRTITDAVSGGDGFSGGDFMTVYKHILSAEEPPAVSKSVIQKVVKKEALYAMMEANLVSVRPVTNHSADYPLTVEQSDELEDFFVAPSPAFLHALRRNRAFCDVEGIIPKAGRLKDSASEEAEGGSTAV